MAIIYSTIGYCNYSVQVDQDSSTFQLELEYTVKTNSVGLDGIREAYNATPAIGSGDPLGFRMVLREKRVKQGSAPNIYQVSCSYSAQSSFAPNQNQLPPEYQLPPLERPAQASFTSELVEKEVLKDVNDKPIQNKADQPFDPPLTVNRALINLNIAKNIAPRDFKPLRFTTYVSKVNSKKFYNFPPNTVMFMEFSGGSLQYEMGQYYIPATFSFKVDPEGWNPVQIAHIGTAYYTEQCQCNDRGEITNLGQNNCRRIATTEDGFVTAQRVFLDKCGRRTKEVEYLSFTIYQSMDFNDLV